MICRAVLVSVGLVWALSGLAGASRLCEIGVLTAGLTGRGVPREFAPVVNGDFEDAPEGAHVPVGWRFTISRDARCVVAVDRTVHRSGKASIRFHNESRMAPHVYGRFVQTVPVKPATGYTLSVWVRGERVRGGQHFTDWKSYSLGLPSGTYEWTKVATTFVTKGDQTSLDVGLNVVNVCEALWLDDVELKADVTPLRVGGGLRGAAAFWCPREVQGDDVEVPVEFYLALPQGFRGKAAVRVAADGEPLAFESADVAGDAKQVRVVFGSGETSARALTVEASLWDANGAQVAEGRREMKKYGASTALARLAEAEQLLARVRELIAQANERRLPSDYPVVTLTVCQNFIPYAREDVEKGEVRRAQEAADEMVGMIQAATADLEKALAEKVTLQPVPRYRTSRIRIVDGHFVAATRVRSTGKRERRPVFFNGYGHFGAVRRDVEKFPRYGVNIIQIEFGPNSVFPEEGVTSEAAIEDFLSVLDRAEKNNVAVNLLLSPHYFPGWALEKWPELGKCGGGFIRFCIDAPEARDIEERFLRVVIPRIRGRRGLHSLCLSNEPIYNRTADCPHTRRLWAEWLEQRHGDIARLNERYGAKYESFADVEVPAADPVREEPRFYDWCVFNQERFAGWHKWMADIIHEIAPDIPVHAKIMPTIFQRRTIGWGVDPELFCEMGQIAGNDCWKMYSGEGEWASGWQTENMFYDLLHSMRGQPVFNSENHLITDRDTAYKPPVHVRNVLWQGAIHGQGATTIWVWERTFDPRSDFSGSIMHRPGCAEAVGKTNLDLMRLSREVALLQSAPAEVAILYSIPSIVYGAEYLSEMSGAYQALNFTGNKIDFISEGQIERGKARQYRLIVIPAAVSVKDETYRGLVRFVRRGGRVAVIGEESLAMNEYKQERDADGLLRSRRCVVIPEGLAARELRDRLLAVLREAHVSGPVKVVEAGSEEPPWGVEWLAAEDGGRTVVNLVNYTNEVKRLRISLPQGGKPVNLFTGRPLPRTVRLEPLEPLLIASR